MDSADSSLSVLWRQFADFKENSNSRSRHVALNRFLNEALVSQEKAKTVISEIKPILGSIFAKNLRAVLLMKDEPEALGKFILHGKGWKCLALLSLVTATNSARHARTWWSSDLVDLLISLYQVGVQITLPYFSMVNFNYWLYAVST